MMAFGLAGLGMVFMMLFWVCVVILAIWLVSRLFPGAARSGNVRTDQNTEATSAGALDILKQRYARGEISRAEYDDMRRGLQA